MRVFAALLCFVVLVTLPAVAAPPQMLMGMVSDVHDGDTFRIGDVRVRIWGIDAVELAQTCGDSPCGVRARDALVGLITGEIVICTIKGRSYDRLVGQCNVDGMDVGQEMARRGMAFSEIKYSKGFYKPDEAAAREGGMGLWSMASVEAPLQWRACHLKRQCKG